MRKHQNNDFKRCQDFEDMGKIRCLCQNGSRHKNTGNRRTLYHCKKQTTIEIQESMVCYTLKSIYPDLPETLKCMLVGVGSGLVRISWDTVFFRA